MSRHIKATERSWPEHDANARFSELLQTCLSEGPQLVTRLGAEVAVLVKVEEWRRLQASACPSLKQLLLAKGARFTTVSGTRSTVRRRTPAAAR